MGGKKPFLGKLLGKALAGKTCAKKSFTAQKRLRMVREWCILMGNTISANQVELGCKSVVDGGRKKLIPSSMVPKGGVEPPRPCGHMVLNHARLPFRHFGIFTFLRDYSTPDPAVSTTDPARPSALHDRSTASRTSGWTAFGRTPTDNRRTSRRAHTQPAQPEWARPAPRPWSSLRLWSTNRHERCVQLHSRQTRQTPSPRASSQPSRRSLSPTPLSGRARAPRSEPCRS